MHALVSPLKLTRSPFKGSQGLVSPDNNQHGGQRETNCGPSQKHKTKQVHDGLQGLDGGNQDQRTNPAGNSGAKYGRRSPVLVGVESGGQHRRRAEVGRGGAECRDSREAGAWRGCSLFPGIWYRGTAGCPELPDTRLPWQMVVTLSVPLVLRIASSGLAGCRNVPRGSPNRHPTSS